MPHWAAGTRTDPPVSVPRDAATRPAATAFADPPEDPPGERSASQGFRTGPNHGFSLENPNAHSWSPVRPISTASAASSRRTHVALTSGIGAGKFAPLVFGSPAWSMRSLMPIGTPASRPTGSRAAIRWSMSSARRSAPSASISVNALSASWEASAAARCSSVTSTAERAPDRITAAMPTTPSCAWSSTPPSAMVTPR